MNAGTWSRRNDGKKQLAAIVAVVLGLSVGWTRASAWEQPFNPINPSRLRLVPPTPAGQTQPSFRPRPAPGTGETSRISYRHARWGPAGSRSSSGDPAAQRIDFQRVSISDPAKNTGVVRIVGVVRNVGQGSFPYRGTAFLYASHSGGGFVDGGGYSPPDDTLLAKVPFQNLAAGQEIHVTADANWPLSNLLVVRIKLVVATDPDSHGDGGDNNVMQRYATGSLQDFPPSSVRAVIHVPGDPGAWPTRQPNRGLYRIIP